MAKISFKTYWFFQESSWKIRRWLDIFDCWWRRGTRSIRKTNLDILTSRSNLDGLSSKECISIFRSSWLFRVCFKNWMIPERSLRGNGMRFTYHHFQFQNWGEGMHIRNIRFSGSKNIGFSTILTQWCTFEVGRLRKRFPRSIWKSGETQTDGEMNWKFPNRKRVFGTHQMY